MSIVLEQAMLPRTIHATVLTGRARTTGEQLAYPVVWADRDYDVCPGCGDPLSPVIETCPVRIDWDTGGDAELQPREQRHARGYWLTVWWVGFRAAGPEPTVDEFQIALSVLISDIPADQPDRLVAGVSGQVVAELPQPRRATGERWELRGKPELQRRISAG